MDVKNKLASFSLGEVVFMVGAMEQQQGGTAWGVETYILFRANYVSTLTLLVAAIQNLPEKPNSPYCVTDFQEKLAEINLEDEDDFVIVEDAFTEGYLSLQGNPSPKIAQKPVDVEAEQALAQESARILEETTPSPQDTQEDDPSFLLGEFMARIHCMHCAVDSYQGEEVKLDGEGVYMLLLLNFDNTVALLKKALETLPEKVLFHGKPMSIQEVKLDWEILSKEEISLETLDKTNFSQGYDQLLARYHP